VVLRRLLTDTAFAGRHQYSLLARFLYQGSQFSRTKRRLKPNAFLPKSSESKISAAWRDELLEDEIWRLGLLAGEGRGKPPLARADFDAEAVSKATLRIESDPMPHNPRHVNVCGWPIEKDERISIAQVLCARATLILRETAE
jgi:hypothetical protein